MQSNHTIVLATNNQGKVAELQDLVAEFAANVKLLRQGELSVAACDETGLTFVENAIIKARHVCRHTTLPAIADDSGLIVDALGGAPGIMSARYASPEAVPSDANNIAKLLCKLADIPEERRGARFFCAMVYLRYTNDPTPIICQGVWEGRVLTTPRGSNGFGYDPIFWVPDYECSAAELSSATKNRISHRAQALRQLLQQLRHRYHLR